MANALVDLLQSASNSAADTVGAPVDALAWLLRKAGVPVPDNPMLGTKWQEQAGLRRPVAQGAAQVAGETLGLLAPTVAAAKAPQIAAGLLQAGENLRAPTQVGMAASQRGVIPVVFKKASTMRGGIDILDDGTVIVSKSPYGYASAWDTRDRIFQAASDKFNPEYDHFFRFTNNKKELDLLRAGELRNSMNHANNIMERGLSVADGPHYGIQGYRYGYPINGKVVGYGSDGEPLLDPRTAQALVGRLQSPSAIMSRDKAMRARNLKKSGAPPDYFVGGHQDWLNNLNTFEPRAGAEDRIKEILRLLELSGAPSR